MSGNRIHDPSKLHLKKELTQIRKAARVLRDPGTSSSWKSPLSSTRSANAALLSALTNGANPVHRNPQTAHHQFEPQNAKTNNTTNNLENGEVGKEKDKDKEKRVFLYNWRSNLRSSSEKSSVRLDVDGDNGGNNDAADGSSGTGSVASASASASVDDSLTDARNADDVGGRDSQSDNCAADILNHKHHTHRAAGGKGCRPSTAAALRCRDTSMASPTMVKRAMGKMKFRKPPPSYLVQKKRRKRLQQLVLDMNSLNANAGVKSDAPSNSLVLSHDDSFSLVEQSDDTGDFYNPEDLRHFSSRSPLLSRLRQKKISNSSAKFLRGHRREDSSYTYSTPALSTSSFNMYITQLHPTSTVGSWEGTTVSFNDADDDVLDDPLNLPGQRGCGISSYWSKKTPKHRGGCGSCCSPSLSDTLRRTGSRLICGSQKAHHKRHQSLPRTSKKRMLSASAAQGRIPLLSSCDGGTSSLGTGNSDDELSTNFGELNLEGMSRLDGWRWSSSCRSQDGLEILAFGGDGQEETMSENIRSLSEKYRPMFFNELVGQNIVVQSLINSIARGKIAPVYLFQGPRGTGKTSTVKIFAAALNCLSVEGMKPCGICKKCSDFITSKRRDILEVDATNKKGIDRVRHLLKRLSMVPPLGLSRYKVFVIDECHLLQSKTWLALLKFLEEPLPQVVFVFITTDLENVPRTILSRCQKYLFNKIKDGDIVSRLQKIAAKENLEVELDALELIALNADGSLRDAETMLEQLSLLGKRITTTHVNELVGVVSDEKLLELLELAISSNTAETVKRARELLDSGADPLVLMSQLASLIMDIIAGSYLLDGTKDDNQFSGGQCLTELELEKLKRSLKLLSEAEKQLRVSSERSTWFTATLLQLGSVTSPEFTLSGSSKRQSSKTTDEAQSTASRDAIGKIQMSGSHYRRRSSSSASLSMDHKGNSAHQEAPLLLMDGLISDSRGSNSQSISIDSAGSADGMMDGNSILRLTDIEKLDGLWLQCTRRCHYEKLRQLLQNYGRLVSISEADGVLLAYIAFGDEKVKARAERYLISITNSFESVLRKSVEVRIILLPDLLTSIAHREVIGYPNPSSCHNKVAESSLQVNRVGTVATVEADDEEKLHGSPLLDKRSAQHGIEVGSTREGRPEIPMQRIESIIREQRLETAWLQAVEKGTPRTKGQSRPERNQVLPQDVGGICPRGDVDSMSSMDLSSQNWEDELNHEIKVLKVNDKKAVEKDHAAKRVEPHPISPSLLHQSSCTATLNKEYTGYESGPGGRGCNMLLCWNTGHLRGGKVKQGGSNQPQKGRFSCLTGCCTKSRHC